MVLRIEIVADPAGGRKEERGEEEEEEKAEG
jgi:hypothetical protein